MGKKVATFETMGEDGESETSFLGTIRVGKERGGGWWGGTPFEYSPNWGNMDLETNVNNQTFILRHRTSIGREKESRLRENTQKGAGERTQ